MRLPLCLALLALGTLPAAETTPPEAPANPPDLFAAPTVTRPLRIAIYQGPGAGESGVATVTRRAQQLPGATVTALTPAEIGTRELSGFDLIVFSGGSGSAQAKAIGEAGRRQVRAFVENGGGYLGICAGAYLACAGFDWGLGILNARTVSNKWQRGRGMMRVQLSPEGQQLFGPVAEPFTIRYANGPIIKPLGRADLPPYAVAAWYRTEIARNGTPEGVMINSPAAVHAPFGRGKVLTISPHAEDTPGLEQLIPRAIAWLAAAR